VDHGGTNGSALYIIEHGTPRGVFVYGSPENDGLSVVSTDDTDVGNRESSTGRGNKGEKNAQLPMFPTQAAFMDNDQKVICGSADGNVPIFSRRGGSPTLLLRHGGNSAVCTVHVSEMTP
jgi:hypothetical protein